MTRYPDKVRENRLRRIAERRGWTLHKCPRRDPLAVGYGTYRLAVEVDSTVMHEVCTTPGGYGLTIDQVEQELTKETN